MRLQTRFGATRGRGPGMGPQAVGTSLCWYVLS